MSSGTFDQLVDATRDAVVAPAGVLSDQELTKELMALRRLADVAEAAYLTRLRAFDQAGVSESQQALSTRAWVRHKLHVAPIETSRSLKLAKRLADLPVIEAALIAGDIRVPHAAAIADAAALLGVDVIAGCQDVLVEAAKADDPTRLRAALRGLGAAVDNKKAVKRAEKRGEGRWLDLSRTFDDTLAIDGVLPDDDTAAIIEAAISSLAHPTGPDDSRTPAQRKALRIRDRGCRFPGCDRPAEWTDVHHRTPWAHGGETNVGEMILLCRKHHVKVHEGGWSIRPVGPGKYLFVGPNGVAHVSPPLTSTSTIVNRLVEATGTSPPRAGPDSAVDHDTGRSGESPNTDA